MSAYFLLFHTIHDVLKAEKALKKEGCSFELVPVPRNLSSDCGSCIRLDGDPSAVTPYLRHIELDRCFFFDGRTYSEMDPPAGDS